MYFIPPTLSPTQKNTILQVRSKHPFHDNGQFLLLFHNHFNFFNNESKINLEGAGLGRRDGPLSNSSAEGAAFIPMVEAICLGLNRLSPVG